MIGYIYICNNSIFDCSIHYPKLHKNRKRDRNIKEQYFRFYWIKLKIWYVWIRTTSETERANERLKGVCQLALAFQLAVVCQSVCVDTNRDMATIAVGWIWHKVYEVKKVTLRTWSFCCAFMVNSIYFEISFIQKLWFSGSEQIMNWFKLLHI